MPLTLKERIRGAIERGMIGYRREQHDAGRKVDLAVSGRELELIGLEVAPLLETLEREHVAELRAYQVADQDTRARLRELEVARDAAKRSLNGADARADRLERQLEKALARLGLTYEEVDDVDDALEGIPTILARLERVASNLEARELGLEGRPRLERAECCEGLPLGKRCHDCPEDARVKPDTTAR